jgi:hypothetical protein
MRRDLEIRCVSSVTVRSEGSGGARWELRERWLELDGAPAHVQILETRDHGERRRDRTVEFGRISVRSRVAHDAAPAAGARRLPLDWLLSIVEAMEEGERRTVALWVRSPAPEALLHATPATESRYGRLAHEAGEAAGATLPVSSSSPRLRLVAAGS